MWEEFDGDSVRGIHACLMFFSVFFEGKKGMNLFWRVGVVDLGLDYRKVEKGDDDREISLI